MLFVQWVGAWDESAIKPTIYAFLGTCVLVGRAVSAYDGQDSLRRLILGVLKLSIVIDFVVNLYVFPVYVELVLIPVLMLLTGVQVVASRDPEQAQVKKFAEFLLVAIGIGLLVYSLIEAATSPDAVLTWENVQALLVVPATAVVFVPFLWAVMRVSRWEMARMRRRFQARQAET